MMLSSHVMSYHGFLSMLQGGYVTPYDPFNPPDICNIYNGDFPTYPEDHVQFLRDFFLAQIDSYESGPSGVGWFMWTMKVILASDWLIMIM